MFLDDLKTRNPKADFLIRVCRELPAKPTIVEIGCALSEEEDPTGGWSTFYLAQKADTLISVDVDATALDIAHRLSAMAPCTHYTRLAKGEDYLCTKVVPSIDLLLLDGSDYPSETLLQARYGIKKLAPNGIIVIDDVQPIGEDYFGKGQLAIPLLIQEGFKCLIEPTLWQDDSCWAMAKLWRDNT